MTYSPSNPYPVGTKYRSSEESSLWWELTENYIDGYRYSRVDGVGLNYWAGYKNGLLYKEGTEVILPKSSNFKLIYDILND